MVAKNAFGMEKPAFQGSFRCSGDGGDLCVTEIFDLTQDQDRSVWLIEPGNGFAKDVAKFVVVGGSTFYPAGNGAVGFGGSSNRWATMYGTTANFTGTVTAPTFSGNATSATTATTATTATNLSGGTVNATSGSFSGTVTTSSVFIGNLTGNATNATNAQTAAAVTGLIKFISTEITCPAATANVSQAHGKGSAPTIANAVLRCVTASDGWGVGDEIILTDTENCGFQIWSNATSIGWVYSTTSAGAPEIRTPVGVTQRCTAANWKVVLKGVWLP